jgi:ribosome-dependent ATPase
VPYIALALLNFLVMVTLAIVVFGVPIKGSFITFLVAALIFVICTTGIGLLISAFTRSQIAAIYITMIGTVIPYTKFSGMTDPVSSLQGVGAFVGRIYPATHFLNISRGVFNKALDMSNLSASLWPMLVAVPVIVGLSILLLKKQET